MLRGTVPQEARRYRGECSGYRGAYGSIGSGGVQGRGWIERTIDEDDRRSVRVSITPAGREKLLDNMSRVVGSLNRILSVFTEDEMRDVARLYSKFASATAEQLGER